MLDHVDEILVLHEDAVIVRGTHRELLDGVGPEYDHYRSVVGRSLGEEPAATTSTGTDEPVPSPLSASTDSTADTIQEVTR